MTSNRISGLMRRFVGKQGYERNAFGQWCKTNGEIVCVWVTGTHFTHNGSIVIAQHELASAMLTSFHPNPEVARRTSGLIFTVASLDLRLHLGHPDPIPVPDENDAPFTALYIVNAMEAIEERHRPITTTRQLLEYVDLNYSELRVHYSLYEQLVERFRENYP